MLMKKCNGDDLIQSSSISVSSPTSSKSFRCDCLKLLVAQSEMFYNNNVAFDEKSTGVGVFMSSKDYERSFS